jgi:hypothetical protein
MNLKRTQEEMVATIKLNKIHEEEYIKIKHSSMKQRKI